MRELGAQLPVVGEPPKTTSISPPADKAAWTPGANVDNAVEYVDKAIAYITRGNRFVVFEEPHFPEAGTQVPGGTVEPGESFEAAVLREAHEETGLTNLRLVRALGSQLHHRPSGRIHRRHYFHLVDESPTERSVWEHYEEHPHSGCDPILYRLRWANLDKPPELHIELDWALRQLRLGLTQPHRQLRRVDLPHRYAARALIFDPANRVLLLRARVSGQELWVTPGGGVQDDESYVAALQREVAEEVGLAVNVGPIAWVRRYSSSDPGCLGGDGDSTELFFQARVAEADYRPAQADDYVFGHKWWSLDELCSSNELFSPRLLPSLLPAVLASAVGRVPLDIGL